MIVSPGLLTASVAAAGALGEAANAAISPAFAQAGNATAWALKAVRAMLPQVGLPGTSRSPGFSGRDAASSSLPRFQGKPGGEGDNHGPFAQRPLDHQGIAFRCCDQGAIAMLGTEAAKARITGNGPSARFGFGRGGARRRSSSR